MKRSPPATPVRFRVGLQSGSRTASPTATQVKSYPGFPTKAFTWDEIAAKFDKLVVGRADHGLATEIKAAVRSLETIQVKDLMKLLGHVRNSRDEGSSAEISVQTFAGARLRL